MSKQARWINYPGLKQRHSYDSEQLVRKMNGLPVNSPTFSNGICSFVAGSTQKITYPIELGVQAIRIKLEGITSFYMKLSASRTIQIVAGTVSVTGFTSETLYVNGVVGTSVGTNAEIIISDTVKFNCNDIQVGYDGSNYGTFGIDLDEYYNRILTASEVYNFYHNLWNIELHITSDILLNYSSTNGVHEDSQGNTLTLTNIGNPKKIGAGKYSGYYNGSSDNIPMGNIGTIKSLTFAIYYDGTDQAGIIDLDGGTNTVEHAGGTISHWADDCYINRENNNTLSIGWNLITIIDNTGTVASAFRTGYDGTTYYKGLLAFTYVNGNTPLTLIKHTQFWSTSLKRLR